MCIIGAAPAPPVCYVRTVAGWRIKGNHTVVCFELHTHAYTYCSCASMVHACDYVAQVVRHTYTAAPNLRHWSCDDTVGASCGVEESSFAVHACSLVLTWHLVARCGGGLYATAEACGWLNP